MRGRRGHDVDECLALPNSSAAELLVEEGGGHWAQLINTGGT